MNINKLPSGKWRIQAHFTVDGKSYRPSYTASTKAECQYWYAEQKLKYKHFKPSDMTVRKAMEEYISLGTTLSPKSIDSYNKILKYAFQSIMDMKVDDLDDLVMQRAVNEEAKRTVIYRKDNKVISPKTVSNEYGLVATALKVICGKTFSVRLPQKTRKLRTYPHPKEILDILRGTEIEIPCLMAMFLSLRMSETRGARYSSIKNGYLFVDQVKITVEGEDIIRNEAKTYKSIRKVKIPEYLYKLIQANKTDNEYIVTLSEQQISKRFKRLMIKHGYDLTYHSLRHLFATSGALCNIQPMFLADFGGWSNTRTLESTYEEIVDSERRKAEDTLAKYFDSLTT